MRSKKKKKKKKKCYIICQIKMSVVGGFILTCMLGRVNIYTGSGAVLGLHTAMLLAASDAIPCNIIMMIND